jgi:heterokaryon incompatibility protein (HET)
MRVSSLHRENSVRSSSLINLYLLEHQLVTSQLVIDDPMSAENIAEAVLAWRRKCHDTHECWKPLAERRSPETSYIQTAGTEEVMRQSTYYIRGRRLPPMQSVDPPEIEPENYHLDDVPLPSRCLEIIRCTDSGDFRFRLRETARQRGKYIILSHRWVPDTERVRTLKVNLEHRLGFRDGVPADEPPLGPEGLTSVFLDAAILSWQLGVPYIWIDSLCIVQDDGND